MKGPETTSREFTALFPFCGLGAGARGFLQARARLGEHGARIVNLGGIDLDPAACADFRYLTGGPALEADLSALTPDELLAFAGARRPDLVFLSPPCKGFSRLLSRDVARTEKYERLNRLVLQAMFLVCETWKRSPPPAIIIENVPGIVSRGALLLSQVKSLLRSYGYVFHEGIHDCGEVGGLGQHRRRYLLVARRAKDLPAFIYRPPRLRVKGCGEILETLPMPDDAEAGRLHELPSLSWLNWVRLALIPAGGDWRDLPASVPEAMLQQTAAGAGSFKGRPGLMSVNEWKEPLPTVTGSATFSGSNGTAAVADPRVPGHPELRNPIPEGKQRRSVWARWDVRGWDQPARTVAGPGMNGGFGVADPRVARGNADPTRGGALGVIGWEEPAPTGNMEPARGTTPASVADPRPWGGGRLGVTPWDKPSPTIRGESYPSNGGGAVADPRIPLDHEPWPGALRVAAWDEPMSTIRGSSNVRTGPSAVADPRLGVARRSNRFTNQYRMRAWDEPAGAVTGDTDIQEGAQSIADPRLGLPENPNRHEAKYRVTPWGEPAHPVTGARPVTSGGPAVADPRLTCRGRNGWYGVLSWREAAASVTGSACIDNGPFAVADPRKPPPGPLPIIVAEDGTWHRPLTTLELAALQGLPARVDGEPLRLSGRTVSGWRERIGNAVPVQAARAIGESILTALLAAALGTWTLGSEGIWVRRDGLDEASANAPWLPTDLAREEARFQAERW